MRKESNKFLFKFYSFLLFISFFLHLSFDKSTKKNIILNVIKNIHKKNYIIRNKDD